MAQRTKSRAEPDTQFFRIAGWTLAVASPDVPLAAEREPDYLPFLDRGGAVPTDVTIELRLGDPSLPAGARLLLEAGEAWTAHECGDELLVAPRIARGAAHPDWLARVGPDRRRVRVVCCDTLLTGTGPLLRLASPVHYPLDQILLSLAFAGEALIIHAAGIGLGGGSAVLAGASGAGKTTMARLCAAAAHPVLSDDRVIVRRFPDGWRLFGTPWPGEGKYAENRGLPLRGVVFLLKGDENRGRPLAPADCIKRLLPVASVPWYDRTASERCLDLAADLAAGVSAHELTFRPEGGAVRALEGLTD